MLRVMTLPAIMATAAVLVACGGAVATSVPGSSAPPPPALPRPTIPLAPWQLQSQLEGAGPDVTGPYEMVPGVITVFVLYEGDGPFSLIFVDEDQGEMRSIESRPGPYNGERVHSVFDGDVGGLVPGPYTLDVEATGPWRMRLFQERAVSGQRPEITLAGSGDGGGSWLQLGEGEYTMTTNHTGLQISSLNSSIPEAYRRIISLRPRATMKERPGSPSAAEFRVRTLRREYTPSACYPRAIGARPSRATMLSSDTGDAGGAFQSAHPQ